MIDHRRAGRRAKRRGDRGELEVRDMLREHGWVMAHRQFQSGGQGGGDLADAIPDVHLEVKLVEKLSLPATFRQCAAAARPTDRIVIAHRCNMQPWLATVELGDLVDLQVRNGVFRVIGERVSVRSEMFDFLRDQSFGTLVLVHSVAGRSAATLLLTELLALLSADREMGLAG